MLLDTLGGLEAEGEEEAPMSVNKPHREFHAVDMTTGWSAPPGYPAGIEQKILAGTLDEAGRSGSPTRLLRFPPHVFPTPPLFYGTLAALSLLPALLTRPNPPEP